MTRIFISQLSVEYAVHYGTTTWVILREFLTSRHSPSNEAGALQFRQLGDSGLSPGHGDYYFFCVTFNISLDLQESVPHVICFIIVGKNFSVVMWGMSER